MSRIVLSCALAVTVAVAGSIATAFARADRVKKVGPPTLLWKAYPLAPRAKATAKAELQPKAATPPEPRPKAFVPPRPRRKAATPSKPRPKATSQTKSRRQAASYQISTDQTGTPRLLLLAVFLGGLLAVAVTMIVGWKLVATRDRRRRRSTVAAARASDDDLLQALQPKPQPEPLPEPVVAETVGPTRERVVEEEEERTEHEPAPIPEPALVPAHEEEPTVARCEIKLWRGFAKCHLYAAPADSYDEPIIYFSPYFRLLEDERSSSQGLQALAVLVEELEEDGWTVVSDGPAWYQHRLERSEGS
jgi:hypothetical protein